MNALKYHWHETSLAVLKLWHVVSKLRFYLQEVCARDWFCILPRMKKFMAYSISKIFQVMLVMLTTLFLKENFNMWVTSGLFCGSVSQMGQQVQPTFNPDSD